MCISNQSFVVAFSLIFFLVCFEVTIGFQILSSKVKQKSSKNYIDKRREEIANGQNNQSSEEAELHSVSIHQDEEVNGNEV